MPAVSIKLGGPRTRVLGFLTLGSVFVVIWKWDSFSWHIRGMILAAYGVVCLGAVLIPALRTRGLLKSGAHAQGTVVDVKKGTSSGQYGGSTSNPVVRFTTADGRTVEFTSAVGYSRSPDIGGAVPVRYRPGDPEQAEIDRATMWMIPAAFGLVGGLGLLVAAVIVYSSQASKAAPTAAAPVTSPPSPAATSTTIPSAASTTQGSSPVNGTPGTGRLGAKVVPAPSGFTLSQPSDVLNGPISPADFDQYWGDPASLHFARGYDVTYDREGDASDSIEVTLFQFATPADAAAFKADWVPGTPVKSKADPVIPGADDYDSTSPDQGTYTHGVIATKGNWAFVIEDINPTDAPVPLVETMARQQYAAL